MQIVRYREQLGGYYSVEQLREIPRIDQHMLDTVIRRFTLDTTRITPIRVNRCAVSTLSRHPYLRFEQARAIYEHRRRHIRLSGMDDLRGLPELSQDDLQRLRPYLSFEQ
jgi:DNA uptake protein ComE-like DNA-binding protein